MGVSGFWVSGAIWGLWDQGTQRGGVGSTVIGFFGEVGFRV